MSTATDNAAIQTLLTSVAQALPTNGAQPLVGSGAQPLPTTPASPLQVLQNTILPVINPNAYQFPAPTPWYKKTSNVIAIGVGVGGLLLLFGLARGKKRK